MDTETMRRSWGSRIKHGALKLLAIRTHRTAREKGFYASPVIMDKVAGKLALVHSEVTETLEALRKEQGKDKVTEEMVDILIRTLSLHEWLVELDLATDDLDERMAMVMDRNDARPSMHGHRWG
jgi:NTP pyrophosphatase (non-canonical NTP hydrolase)